MDLGVFGLAISDSLIIDEGRAGPRRQWVQQARRGQAIDDNDGEKEEEFWDG